LFGFYVWERGRHVTHRRLRDHRGRHLRPGAPRARAVDGSPRGKETPGTTPTS